LKTYKHLFFDLDNTLWDFKANANEAFYVVFNRLGIMDRIPDMPRFLEVYEKYNEHLWTEYRRGKIKKDHLRHERITLSFQEMGIEDPELCRQVVELYIREAPQRTNLFDGVHETLGYLCQKYKLYIVTNGFAEIQIQKINNCGLNKYFNKLFIAEVIGYQKPDRRLFEYAVKSIHAHKSDCVMIGDDPEADIRGAWNAGIDQIFYNNSGKSCMVEPTCTINSIVLLRDLL
jgi:putative hydrolase of the HAD superfamily